MFDATRANFQGVTPKTLDDRFYDFTRIISHMSKRSQDKTSKGVFNGTVIYPPASPGEKTGSSRHQTWCFCRDHGLRKGLNVTTGCSNLG